MVGGGDGVAGGCCSVGAVSPRGTMVRAVDVAAVVDIGSCGDGGRRDVVVIAVFEDEGRERSVVDRRALIWTI